MKFSMFFILTIFIILSFSLSKACLKTVRIENREINGFELEEYLDINSFEQGDGSNSMLGSILDLNDQLVYTRYNGDIKIEVFMTETDFFTIEVIQSKILNIFNFASEHLQENFGGLNVNRKLYIRILACCIEYGSRREKTIFRELRENINCVTKLGLDGSQKDMNWISNKWDERDVFEIVL